MSESITSLGNEVLKVLLTVLTKDEAMLSFLRAASCETAMSIAKESALRCHGLTSACITAAFVWLKLLINLTTIGRERGKMQTVRWLQ